MSTRLLTMPQISTAEIFWFDGGLSQVLAVIRWQGVGQGGGLHIDCKGGEQSRAGLAYGDRWSVDRPYPLEFRHCDGGTLEVDGVLPDGCCIVLRAPVTPGVIVHAMVSDENQSVSDFVGALIGDRVTGMLEASYPPMATWNRLGVDQGIGAAFVRRYIKAIEKINGDGPRARADQVLSVWKSMAFESLTITAENVLMSETPGEPVVF